MPERSRLLIHSNAPWSSTGYGQQCGIFAPRLNESYSVGVSSFYGLEGARLNWQDMVVYPGIGGDYGNASLLANAKAHFGGDPRGGTVLTLMDVWVLDPSVVRQINVACWVPVDHEPAPPRVLEFFAHSGAVPIAMSRFGEKMLAGYDPLYVPHGIDTSVYRPLPKTEARGFTEFPEGKFIVGMVAANKGNPSRKCFAEALLAFKHFRASHPDAILYLHTEMSGRFDGVNLAQLLAAVEMPEDSVFFPDQDRLLLNPFSHSAMANVYNSLDVLLCPSAGEGFGIPVLEANACGVPAIVTDFSAQAEVCGAGWKVKYSPNWTAQGSWQAHPDVQDILDALKAAHKADERAREAMSRQARAHAEGYDADLVTSKYFLPALEQVAERFAAREPVTLKAAA
jgi:glycosyltransferase involved in cell wall biosynthesis